MIEELRWVGVVPFKEKKKKIIHSLTNKNTYVIPTNF
jgi:hypothetical protein